MDSTVPSPPLAPDIAPLAATAPRLPFSLFLGLRYLKPRRSFVSIITLISVTGVSLGIAVLIVVISVMTGFDRELRNKVLGFEPHVQVTNGGLMEDWREVRKTLLGTPGITGAAPYVQGPVLVEANNQRVGVIMRGVDPKLEPGVTDVAALMAKGPRRFADGKFDLDGDDAVIGTDLAHTLDLQVGDKLTIISSRNIEKLVDELKKHEGQGSKSIDEKEIASLREMVAPQDVTVTGIFDSGRSQFDSQFIFVPLHLAQELYEFEGGVHGVAARTQDPYHVEVVQQALYKRLTPPLTAQTWIDRNSGLLGAVHTERITMFVILFVVLVVAAFSVMNTLITVTVLKTREIGIMKAIGAGVGQIVRVFLSQGVVVGIFGTVGGLALGLGVLALLNPFKDFVGAHFGVDVFSRNVYGFGSIPYWTDPFDVAIICVSMFTICSLAALLPAYFAARLDPVKALRFE